MAKPIKLTVALRALFAVNNSSRARWGSRDAHPVVNATVEIEGHGLRATTNKFGYADLDVSSLSSGDYVLALTPEAGNLLRNSSEPVGAGDGNTTDKAGTCRYRPLRLNVSLTISGGGVRPGAASPCDGATHGAAFVEKPAELLIDWKPDWVACRRGRIRPAGVSPTIILLHRTAGPTPGSALDTFLTSDIASHYLVDVDGHVIKLVHEDIIAYHAGESWWAGQSGVGKLSVGIEIVNEGGDFTQAQYDAVIGLVRELQRNYPDITRHGILGHSEVRVAAEKNLKLEHRPGCPGIHFDWRRLEDEGLGSKADPSLFDESQIDEEYGGCFKDKPEARLPSFIKDGQLLRKDKTPYNVIAALQADLSLLGYSINAVDGMKRTGEYDAATQAAVDRFRRRYMPGVVRSNELMDSIFDRATAIALKRALLDRSR
jgi:N-acetyl-anhydromuramyl-L-alanine amidase AmpD